MKFEQFIETAVTSARDISLRYNPENWLNVELNEDMIKHMSARDTCVRELVSEWEESKESIINSVKAPYIPERIINMERRLIESFSFIDVTPEKIPVPKSGNIKPIESARVDAKNQATADSVITLFSKYVSAMDTYNTLIISAIDGDTKRKDEVRRINEAVNRICSELPPALRAQYPRNDVEAALLIVYELLYSKEIN